MSHCGFSFFLSTGGFGLQSGLPCVPIHCGSAWIHISRYTETGRKLCWQHSALWNHPAGHQSVHVCRQSEKLKLSNMIRREEFLLNDTDWLSLLPVSRCWWTCLTKRRILGWCRSVQRSPCPRGSSRMMTWWGLKSQRSGSTWESWISLSKCSADTSFTPKFSQTRWGTWIKRNTHVSIAYFSVWQKRIRLRLI